MRVAVITGGRDYAPSEAEAETLRVALKAHDITHVMHGACPDPKGGQSVDMWAHRKCKAWGYWVIAVPALWEKHGRAAGPKRNVMMGELANALHAMQWEPRQEPVCISFKGGTGTLDMVRVASGHEWQTVRIES